MAGSAPAGAAHGADDAGGCGAAEASEGSDGGAAAWPWLPGDEDTGVAR